MILKDYVDEKYSQLLTPGFRRTTALHLHPVEAETPEAIISAAADSPTGSRVGGAALVTTEYPWPRDNHNNPMIHLAQLNLAELPTREGYPTEGLLQFFINDDYRLGLFTLDNDGHPDPTSGGRVVRLIPVEQFAAGNVEYHQPNLNDDLFLRGFFTVTGQLYDQAPSVVDRDFKKLGIDYTNDSMLDMTLDKILDQSHLDIFGGGWAHFTQEDPRADDDPREILLQLDTYMKSDSPVQLVWGAAPGIANFFISKKDLANLDFSNVLYNWDCG